MSHWQDDIRSRLKDLRGAIRRYLVLEGLAVVVVLLGTWFWLTYLLDLGYFSTTRLELPRGFRSAAVVLGMGGIAAVAIGWLVTRVFRPFRIDALALLLERKFPDFNGRLMTALRSFVPDGKAAQLMAERNEAQAADRLRDVDVLDVLNPLPLRRWSMAAGAILVSIIAFGATNAQAMSRWSDAYLRGKTGYWDEFRRTRIELRIIRQPGDVEVPFVDGAVKHARGAHLTLVALVPEGSAVPNRVTLSIRSAAARGELLDENVPMTPSGDGRFRHTILRVVDDLTIDVTGGDFTTVTPYYVDVVDAPRIDAIVLDCTYPNYTGLNVEGGSLVPVQSSTIELPFGTRFQMQATSNKPIAQVRLGGPDAEANPDAQVRIASEESSLWTIEGQMGAGDSEQSDSARMTFASSEPLQITLTDTDGITSQEPIELVFLARQDTAPVVAVEPNGIGTSVTRQARLPFKGLLTDDYALNEAWFDYSIRTGQETAEENRQLLDLEVANRKEVELDSDLSALDLRPLGLSIGQQLRLMVGASDTNDLTGPGVGRSELSTLTIVSNEELLALLYDKEVNLRQRFERILEEVRETRDDMALAQRKSREGGDSEVWNQIGAATEQAVLAIRKNDGETRSIITLFGDIRAELVNNRVDTADMLNRIDRGIVGPLERVIETHFPESETAVVEARQITRGDAAFDAATEPLGKAVSSLSQLVARLEAVLNEMQRRQSYNQLITELQRLIEQQKKLKTKTEEKSVDDLFGDLFD